MTREPGTSPLQRLLAIAARRPALCTLVVVGLLYLPWLAAGPVTSSIEASRLVASREMLARGDWVLPTRNGAEYLAKPPFQYWLVEVAFALFGSTLWAGRLVSAAAVIVTALLLEAWVRPAFGRRASVAAALVFASSGLVLEKGVLAELEAVLVATVTGALCGTWYALTARRRGLWVLAAGVSLGASLLTKGPVVLLAWVPASVALVVALRERRLANLGSLLAILAVGIGVGLPWLLALSERVGLDHTLRVFGLETLQRTYAPGAGNRAPVWFYLPKLPAVLAPGVLLLPRSVRFLRSRRVDPALATRIAFLAAWACGPPLLLTLSAGKEARYLMPCLPAWAALLGCGVLVERSAARAARLRAVLARLLVGATWLAPVVVAAVGASAVHAAVLPWVLVGAGLLGLARVGAWRARRAGSDPLLAAAALTGLLGVKVLWARAYLGERSQRIPTAAMGAAVAERLDPADPLLVAEYDAAIHFAVARQVVTLEDVESGAPVPAWALAEADDTALRALRAWKVAGTWTVLRERYELLEAESPRAP